MQHFAVIAAMLAATSIQATPLHEGPYLTDQTTSQLMLKGKGYTEIKMTGFDLSGEICGKHNLYVDKFKAKSPDGKSVEGIVCGDFFPEIKLLRYLQ